MNIKKLKLYTKSILKVNEENENDGNEENEGGDGDEEE